MYKQKNIICFSLFIVVTLHVFAQDDSLLISIKKEISKTDRLWASEFSSIKRIPVKKSTTHHYEAEDSLAFYIAKYEVTNIQYRQFLEYVQDSILRKLLGYVKEGPDGNEYNDLSKKIDVRKVRRSIEFSGHGPFTPMFTDTNGIILLKPRYLVYAYRSEEKRIQISVMPGMEGTMGVYPYSYKEPEFNNYFYNPAFDNCPVTGVSFFQAKAYCNWKTQQLKNTLGKSSSFDIAFSLPTQSQFEAASSAGLLSENNSKLSSKKSRLEDRKQACFNTKSTVDKAIGFRYVIFLKASRNDY